MKTTQTDAGFFGTTGGHESADVKTAQREDAFGQALEKMIAAGRETEVWDLIEKLCGKRFADELDRILKEQDDAPEGERFRSPRHGKSTRELFGSMFQAARLERGE